MDGRPCDERRTQEGHEHQSMTHQKSVTLRICYKGGSHYITESMPVGRVEFLDGSGVRDSAGVPNSLLQALNRALEISL